MMLDTATARPHLKAGSIKALAAATSTRLAQLPDTPTFKELGYEVEVHAWQGLVVPAATPQPIRDRLTQALQKTLADPEVTKTLTDFGLEIAASDAKTMGQYTESETRLWHPLIGRLGLKLEN